MRVIGITGGVGAGKSAVLSHLEQEYGAFVIQADQVGHLVMEPKGPAYGPILQAFEGACKKEKKALLHADGTIDRSVLSGIVFSNREKLELLNAIVHPAVKEWVRREIAAQRQQGCRLLVVEAALLIEDHYEELCQEFWYLHTDAQVRRERLKSSRGYTDEKIDSIFRNQLSEEEFRSHCQAVIDNSGAFEDTCRQIAKLLL